MDTTSNINNIIQNLLTVFQVKYIILYIYRHIPEATSVLCKRDVSNLVKFYTVNRQVFISCPSNQCFSTNTKLIKFERQISTKPS